MRAFGYTLEKSCLHSSTRASRSPRVADGTSATVNLSIIDNTSYLSLSLFRLQCGSLVSFLARSLIDKELLKDTLRHPMCRRCTFTVQYCACSKTWPQLLSMRSLKLRVAGGVPTKDPCTLPTVLSPGRLIRSEPAGRSCGPKLGLHRIFKTQFVECVISSQHAITDQLISSLFLSHS
jgi:hypothetical protein